MGRKKIEIKSLPEARINTTFMKRKAGLVNKARELGILCNTQIALVVFHPNRNEVLDVSVHGSIGDVLERYHRFRQQHPGNQLLHVHGPQPAQPPPPRPPPRPRPAQLLQANMQMNGYGPMIGQFMQPQMQPQIQGGHENMQYGYGQPPMGGMAPMQQSQGINQVHQSQDINQVLQEQGISQVNQGQDINQVQQGQINNHGQA